MTISEIHDTSCFLLGYSVFNVKIVFCFGVRRKEMKCKPNANYNSSKFGFANLVK